MEVERQKSNSTSLEMTQRCWRFGEGGARSLQPDTFKAEGIDGMG